MGDSDRHIAGPDPPPGARPQAVLLANPGAVQVAGTVAGDTISALGAQPVLLLIVVLNMIFCGAGGYFFTRLEGYRHDERSQIIALLSRCEPSDHPAQRRESP